MGDMTLEKYIDRLKTFKPDYVPSIGLGNPHSWRGNYADLAFEPVEGMTAGEMLECAESCVGKSFEGWKGGDFVMTKDTYIHVEREGDYTDGELLWNWFLDLNF